ncbi:MAG: ABC transporter permease [Dehalococcoidia bacterium]
MNYVLSRLIRQFIPVAFVASIAIFVLIDQLPGDPAAIALGETASPEAVAAMREELGLNRPLPIRYLDWLRHSAQGDLGRSILGKPVTDLLTSTIPPTVFLAVMAFTLGNVTGVLLGVAAGVGRGTWIDATISAFTSLLIAVPSFVSGLLILLVFSVRVEWFPSAGYVALTDDPRDALMHVALPTIALAGVIAAVVSRFTRHSIIETMQNDFIRTARAKGLHNRRVVFGHALKPSLLPVVTIIGLQLGGLIGGTIVIEQVFTWPGMGRLLIGSINAKDYPTVQAITMLLVGTYLLFNLLTDLAYGWLDPRVRSALN